MADTRPQSRSGLSGLVKLQNGTTLARKRRPLVNSHRSCSSRTCTLVSSPLLCAAAALTSIAQDRSGLSMHFQRLQREGTENPEYLAGVGLSTKP